MKKTAFLFPGQGSQSVGMGQDFYQEYDEVKELFDMAAETAKLNISRLCFKGPLDELTKTVNLQPAVTAVNLACLAAFEKEGIKADICAGHSLGEYSALCAAGVISKEDTFKLVCKRGELMHREACKYKGAMHALIGLPIDIVEQFVNQGRKKGVVAVANHNAEKQIVITGSPEAVKYVSSLAAEQGARSISLKVSGAWHSDLIQGAMDEFKDYMNLFPFNRPACSVVLNVTGDLSDDPYEIKSVMSRQLCSPVKWYDSMCRLVKEKVSVFVEVGPGKVLAGLAKKILPKDYPCKIHNVNDLKSFERFFNEYAS